VREKKKGGRERGEEKHTRHVDGGGGGRMWVAASFEAVEGGEGMV
jgi:hypothetical protein